MRTYEVVVILDPDLEEKTIAPSLEAFLNVVRSDGGKVNSVDVWGRRRMAYEINHKPEGIYAILNVTATKESVAELVGFAGTPATVAELDRQLRLNEAVMRTKVMNLAEAK